jgi:hypothetical protein
MKYLLLGLGLVLASCASQRPPTSARPSAEATSGGHDEGPAYTPDMLTQRVDSIVIEPERTLLDKLLGRTPTTSSIKSDELPKLAPSIQAGKKSTVSVYYGSTVTNAGKKAQVAAGAGAVASVIEKKAGPAVVASDSSTQNAVLGGGNIQATNGNNNTPNLSVPVQQAADWRAELAKPTGKLIAGALVVLVVGGGVYGFILWRKKKAATNLV